MTSTPTEGVIKFKYNLKLSRPLPESSYINIEKWRAILFKMNLIGEYQSEGVGFGNLSKRLISGSEEFIITGTQTGKHAHLNGSQYTHIKKCNLKKMSLEATGPIAPSSESLTHHAIYSTCPQVNYIFHVHGKDLWNYMLKNGYPKTPKDVDYGTQEMADASSKCIGHKDVGIFAMEGHEDGIIAYGKTAEATGKIILETVKQSRS